jgi:hypothetical protein
MSRRATPSPLGLLWIGVLGGFLLATWLVAGIPRDDVHQTGKAEVATAGVLGRLPVLPEAILPPPMPCGDGLGLPRRGLTPAAASPPLRVYHQHPAIRAPPSCGPAASRDDIPLADLM